MQSSKIRKISLRLIPVIILILLLPEIALLLTSLYYHDNLKSLVLKDLNARIQGQVSIERIQLSHFVHWPYIHVVIKNLNVKYQADSATLLPVFKATKLAIEVNPLQALTGRLVVKKISLSGVQTWLIKNAKGQANWNLFKPIMQRESATEGQFRINISKLTLDSVHFEYTDESKHKHIALLCEKGNCKLKRGNDATHIAFDGSVLFHGLGFNTKKGYYLKNLPAKLTMKTSYSELNKKVIISQCKLAINESAYHLKGIVGFDQQPEIDLQIQAPATTQAQVLALLPQRIAEKIAPYACSGTISAHAHVKGIATENIQPHVDVYFYLRNNPLTLSIPGFSIPAISLNGHYTNHVNEQVAACNANSAVFLDSISANIYGLRATGNCAVNDLDIPHLQLKTRIAGALDSLAKASDGRQMIPYGLTGNMLANIEYSSYLHEWKQKKANHLPGHLEGTVKLAKVGLRVGRTKFPVQQINGSFTVKNDSVSSSAFMFDLPGARCQASGRMGNLYSFLMHGPHPLTINLKLKAKHIDLAKMLKPNKHNGQQNHRLQAHNLPLQTVVGLISFESASLNYKNFSAQSLSGKILLGKNHLDIPILSFNTAGGKALLEGSINQLGHSHMPMSAKLRLGHIDLSRLLHMMDDFGQKSLTHKHITGLLDADIMFSSVLDDDFDLRTSENKGEASFNIRHAELRHFEPIKKISGILFRNRNFDHIQFADIVGQLNINGSQLTFPTIELTSNVLTMFVQGYYRFDNNEEMDLRLSIPFNNLLQRDFTKLPDKKGLEGAEKAGVNLKVIRKNGVTDIGIDLDKTVKRLKNLVMRRNQKLSADKQ